MYKYVDCGPVQRQEMQETDEISAQGKVECWHFVFVFYTLMFHKAPANVSCHISH